MRILHVIPGLGLGGGAEQSFLHGAEALRSAGWELHVVLLSDRRGLVPTLERMGVVVHDLSGTRGLRRFRGLRRIVAAVRPDVVHATLFQAEVLTQVLAPWLGAPLVVTWSATPYSPERRAEQGVTWWKLEVVRWASVGLAAWSRCRFQAVTPGVALENARALHVASGRVTVAERGRPRPPARDATRIAATRRELGCAPEDRLVVCIARQEPQKGLHRLIDALDPLVARVGSVLVVVAGREGTATTSLRGRLAACRHAERLHLLGHRDDVAALLEAADLCVSCSLNEGAAGALIEAMSWGVPVVATPVRGLDGVLEDGRNASVVGGDDPATLAAAMADVLESPELADELARGGRATYEERFTAERSGAALLALYEALAGRTPPRSR